MAHNTKVSFILAVREGGGYSADAVGLPIRVESSRIRDLRRAVKDAVRAHFGREPVEVRLLVGSPSLQAAEAAVAQPGRLGAA